MMQLHYNTTRAAIWLLLVINIYCTSNMTTTVSYVSALKTCNYVTMFTLYAHPKDLQSPRSVWLPVANTDLYIYRLTLTLGVFTHFLFFVTHTDYGCTVSLYTSCELSPSGLWPPRIVAQLRSVTYMIPCWFRQ